MAEIGDKPKAQKGALAGKKNAEALAAALRENLRRRKARARTAEKPAQERPAPGNGEK